MDKRDNVLEVELPKKWIRIPFKNWVCTGIVSVYMSLFGALGIAGIWLVALDILDILSGEQTLVFTSENWPFLFLPLVIWVFYFKAKLLFSRILPAPIQIVGVEIIESCDARWGHLGRYYWFKGASIARVLALLPFANLPISLALKKDPEQRLNRTRFGNKNHKILWLDEKQQIALAAENRLGGGAVLLDEDLTYLRWISQKDRQKLLTSLQTVQADVAKDRRKLRKIIWGIAQAASKNKPGKNKTK